MCGITFLRWMFWLEVDDGFEDPSSHGWDGPRDMMWPGLGDRGGCEQRQAQLPATAARARLLVAAELDTRRGAEQQCSTQLEEVGHKFPASTAQVEFPEGINLLENEPGLDISYNFLTISSSECAAQKKFKQRTTEETRCWPDCQQVPSMSSFSVFLFRVSKC